MSMKSHTHDLFGGAITCTLPDTVIDASDLRQIPDSQEVFVMPDSDLSIIFEVLQAVAPMESLEAIRFHFDALAHDNEAASQEIDTVTEAGVLVVGKECVQRAVLTGRQSISKFNKATSESDNVAIKLALWRIPSKKIDFVAAINDPRPPDDALARCQAESIFDELLTSLTIVDLGLFA